MNVVYHPDRVPKELLMSKPSWLTKNKTYKVIEILNTKSLKYYVIKTDYNDSIIKYDSRWFDVPRKLKLERILRVNEYLVSY